MFSELQLLLNIPYQTRNPVLVDVGAMQGQFSEAFARKGWKVVSFEPEPANFEMLAYRARYFSDVTCVNKAVSDVSGQRVPFYTSSTFPGIHSLRPFHPTHSLTAEVETVRLDDILPSLNVDEVTLLKIDVEGADFLALKSFDFQRYHPEIVMCEFMDSRSLPNFGYTHHDIASFINHQGYTTFVFEWTPIIEYGTKDKPNPTQFIGFSEYPLAHQASWGNLIFVPTNKANAFPHIVNNQITDMRKVSSIMTSRRWRTLVKKIPGAYVAYKAYKWFLKKSSPEYNSSDFMPYIKEIRLRNGDFRFFVATPEAQSWYDPLKPYARLEYEWVLDNIPLKDQKIIDGGAHHGQYSLVFSLGSNNTGELVAVDPIDSNCDIIRVNAALNHVNVEIEKCAIAKNDRSVNFKLQSNGRIVKIRGYRKDWQTTAINYG